MCWSSAICLMAWQSFMSWSPPLQCVVPMCNACVVCSQLGETNACLDPKCAYYPCRDVCTMSHGEDLLAFSTTFEGANFALFATSDKCVSANPFRSSTIALPCKPRLISIARPRPGPDSDGDPPSPAGLIAIVATCSLT